MPPKKTEVGGDLLWHDGSAQWAYQGKPLYFWIKDQKPDDKTGDGFNKVWQVPKP